MKTNRNPRRNFLKSVPLALVSLGTFSFFKIKKANAFPEMKFKTLSKSEANDIIKNEKFSHAVKHKPAAAPLEQKNINE